MDDSPRLLNSISGDLLAEQTFEITVNPSRRSMWLRIKDIVAFSLSAIFHAMVLTILAFCLLPIVVGQEILVSAAFHADDGQELDAIEISEHSRVLPVLDTESNDAKGATSALEVPEVSLLSFPSHDDGQTTATSQSSTSEASSVEGAVDKIMGSIKGQLAKGDLLVVWLFDASRSLVDDRQRVASRLHPFFEEVSASRSEASRHRLLNAVVSFGKGMKQQVAPTEFSERIIQAIEKLGIDESGYENVFTAIARSAQLYRKGWMEGQLVLVVWTDETGDDIHELEKTIKICRVNRASVSIVGPSSVLGSETGLHSYTDPKSNESYQLPVKRGPDSALPERIELGYWFFSRPPGPTAGPHPSPPRSTNGRRFRFPSWYGGRDMRGIASGFSPYALTRLAAQTGGSYTIFDQPEDRGPFRWEAMKAYAPAYDSLADYQRELESHPLRRAIHEAVRVTLGKKLTSPEIMLFVNRDKFQPYKFFRPYLTPKQFAGRLRNSRRSLQQKAARTARIVEEALSLVSKNGQPNQPLTLEYEQESSRRWRAWYDLTRGRLLATSIRLEEYRLALDSVFEKGFLAPSTNHVILLPNLEMKSGEEFRSRAKEAEQLLMRCVEQNPDTPWAYLAQRELDHGLGITVRQRTLTPTPATPANPSPTLPNF